MTNDEHNEVKRWIAEMNKRGTFAAQNPQDRTIMEASTAGEWALAVKEKFGLLITNVRPCQTDPPDCYADFEGKSISIELAELVDGHRLRESVIANETGQDPPHLYGKAFLNTQWSKDRFFRELAILIDKKTAKYENHNSAFDVLLVHTDEPWLSPQQVSNWLADKVVEPRSVFRSAYLLMPYVPGYVHHWPVFLLFGSIAQRKQD
jgi:hypothetical protein